MPKRKELTPEEKMRKEFTHQLAATYKPKTAKEVQDKAGLAPSACGQPLT